MTASALKSLTCSSKSLPSSKRRTTCLPRNGVLADLVYRLAHLATKEDNPLPQQQAKRVPCHVLCPEYVGSDIQ